MAIATEASGSRRPFAFVEDLSIQIKAFAASAVLVICLVLLGAIAYVTLDRSQQGLHTLSTTILPRQQAFAAVNDTIVAAQMKIFRYVSWASNGVDDALLKKLRGQVDADLRVIDTNIAALAGRADLSEGQKAELKDLVARWKDYEGAAKDTLDIGSTDAAMATMMLGGADEKFMALAAGFQQMSSSVVAQTNAISTELSADAAQKKVVLGIGAALGLLLSVVVSVLVTRSIVKPVSAVTDAMQRLSAGDTTVDVGYHGRRDEIGQMVEAIAVFRRNAIEMRAMELESLEAEKRSLKEIGEARARLADAIEAIPEGFSLYDGEDKLVVFNSKYKTLFAADANLVEPGIAFETIIRAGSLRAMVEDATGDYEGWIARRVAQHRSPSSTHIQHRNDGRYIQINERKTAEGGVVATYADISEIKQHEAELARLVQGLQDATAGLTESLEQQTATSEVLRVISSSPTDTHPVFKVIAERAMQLCESQFCAVFQFDGKLIHVAAHHGVSPEGAAAYERGFPLPASRISAIGRAIQDRAIAHIPDVEADPDYGALDVARAVMFRAILAVPLMRDGQPIGGIAVSRATPGPFPAKHIDLLHSFADQAVIAIENVRLYNEVAARTEALATANAQVTALNAQLHSENVRMGSELDITRRLQLMLLPGAEELKKIEGLDIAGHMQPALEVGGDYYDVLQHEGRVKISIGDVTGHGLESGVLVVMTQAIVRALLTRGETDHVRFLTVLNHALYGNVQRMGSDKNLTLCLLDYAAGELKVSGQHEEMIVVRRDGKVERVNTIDLGFPVGLVDEIADFVGQTTVQLQPGDGVVLYTDGITEAENMDDEQYGLERLCAVVRTHWAHSAEAIKEAVVSDVKRYIGQQKVYDDITLVVAKQR